MKRNAKIVLLACVSLFFNFQFSIFNFVQAQQPWNYTTVEEASYDEAYFVQPPAELRRQVEKVAGAPVEFNTLFRLSPVRKRNETRIHFENTRHSFTLDEELVNSLLPYLVSRRYWEQRYSQILLWAFIDCEKAELLVDVDTTDRRYGRYSPVAWLGYRFQPSEQWPVIFSLRTNTRTVQEITLPVLQRLAEWGAFATDAQQLAYEEHNAELLRREEAHRAALQRELDSLDNVGERYARHADSITVVLQRDSLAQAEERLMADVQATKRKMNKGEIFLMSVNPARSDYMFGLEFNFYNCFKKNISKIEITVTPVNAKGQVQKDQFNRDVRTVRCMGPVRPGSPAQYTFDELFWDDKGRIKYMRVTSVTFYFPDGSRKTYNGYEKILKHTLNP